MRIRMGHRGQEEWLFRGICEAKIEKNSIGFSSNLKMEMAIPNAGNHVLASPIVSKDIVSVEQATAKFMQELIIKQ